MMSNFSDRLVEELTDATLAVAPSIKIAKERVFTSLNRLQRRLIAFIVSEDLSINKLDKLDPIINLYFNEAYDKLIKQLPIIAKRSQRATLLALNTTFGSNVFTRVMLVSTINKLFTNPIVLGNYLKEEWEHVKNSFRKKLRQSIRTSYARGRPDQLLPSIAGTRSSRSRRLLDRQGRDDVYVYTGGLINSYKTKIDSLVETVGQTVINTVDLMIYNKYSSMINGVYPLTVFDGGTSSECMARAGSAWGLDGEPLHDDTKEKFPGIPPWHFKCRTRLVPMFRLINDIKDDKILSALKCVKKEVKESMGNTASSLKAFDDVLKSWGDTKAKQKLGPGRFKLWKSGRITTRQLINSLGEEQTLAELKSNKRS